MADDRHAFKLGLTVIASLVLALVGVLFLGGKSFAPMVDIVVRIAHDQNVSQIKKGAAIVCGPQQVGSVTEVATIEAPAVDDSGVSDFLYFEVRGQVHRELNLRSDCRVAIVGSLLGDSGMLRIVHRGTSSEPMSSDEPIYAEATGLANSISKITREFDGNNPGSLVSQIKSQLDPSLSRSMVAKVHKSLDDVNAMTRELAATMDPSRGDALLFKLNSILANVNELTGELKVQMASAESASAMAKVHSGLDGVNVLLADLLDALRENRPGIREAVSGTGRIVQKVDEVILPSIESELDRSAAGSLLSQAHAAMGKVNRSLEEIHSASLEAAKMVTLSQPRVLAFVENAKEASEHLKALAKDLRRSPWRLIHSPSESESKEAYILDAAREFAEAAENLDETVAELGALIQANDGELDEDDPAVIDIRERVQATLVRFGEAEQSLWTHLELSRP
jgi:hypothetical protein